MSYFDLTGCVNGGCALKNTQVFLKNDRRNAKLRSQQLSQEYQREIDQNSTRAANENISYARHVHTCKHV